MLPNTRFKLPAPVRNGRGCRSELRCGRFSFVIISAWRRSLSAIRSAAHKKEAATAEQPWSLGRKVRYFGVAFSFTALAFLLSLLLSVSFDRTFLVVFGLVVFTAGFWKPWWFWQHEDAFWLRDRVGDRLATMVYAAVAITMLYFGLFTEAHLFRH